MKAGGADALRRHRPRIRFALLRHEPMIHAEQFGEIVAANRGAKARVFTDVTPARKRLLSKPIPA